MSLSLIFNVSSTAVFLAIIVGVVLHRRVALHVRIMKTCFALDVLLLVLVEVFRGAVESLLGLQETSADINRTMLYVHVPFAVLSLIWWILQVRSGVRILAGERERIPSHGLHAKIFLVLRLGNLVTAYMLY